LKKTKKHLKNLLEIRCANGIGFYKLSRENILKKEIKEKRILSGSFAGDLPLDVLPLDIWCRKLASQRK
jgi:hypothetical protein